MIVAVCANKYEALYLLALLLSDCTIHLEGIMKDWYLESHLVNNRIMRVPLSRLPFYFGRDEKVDYPIDQPNISRRHAELFIEGGQLLIRDLHSTNGTYVNRHAVDKPTALDHGDVIHIAETELRLISSKFAKVQDSDTDGRGYEKTIYNKTNLNLSQDLPWGIKELEELLEDGQITAKSQKIMAADGSLYGYELLGRGTHALLPENPMMLFLIAESIGKEVELSELMRMKALETAEQRELEGAIFVNTHPAELDDQHRLIDSLSLACKQFPKQKIYLEIHEKAVTDVSSATELKSELQKLGIQLVFDDFGAGQSRLLELIDATPKVLKFDLALIESIHQAKNEKLTLIKKLLEISNELNITALAECVSNKEEYFYCKDLGFDLFQGYHFGKPS